MSLVPIFGLMVMALLAIGFAAIPVWRRSQNIKGRMLVFGALGLFILAIGWGTYFLVGRPHLAERAARGLDIHEINGLVPYLIARVRAHPDDARAWRYLGQAYMAAGDPRDGAKALATVIALTGKSDPALDAAYGEMLVADNAGQVPEEAEDAFNDALKADPKNWPARFYLGLAKASRNDRAGAIAMWQSLLTDVPASAPLHQILVDRLAILSSQSPGGAPDPRAMVGMLAQRLKADPHDALGWVRLMRAYTVLGETAKAKQALAAARKAFSDNKDAQTAFTTAAKALKLE